MLLEIFKFELSSWFKKPALYIFVLVNFLLVFITLSSDTITIGEDLGNININAPYAIFFYVSFMTLLSILMTTTFMNKAALKDYQSNFQSILFTTPISKRSYLVGRFGSGLVLSLIAMLGVYLAFFAIQFMPHLSDKIGETRWAAYFNSFILYVLPNTLLIGALIYGLAAKFRNTTAAFVGSIFLLMAYLTAGSFVQQLDNETVAVLLDPLGIHSFSVITKYWTIDDKNTEVLSIGGAILANRVLWMTFSGLIFLLTYWRTDLLAVLKKKKKKTTESVSTLSNKYVINPELPKAQKSYGFFSKLEQFKSIVRTEFWTTVKSPAFIAITLFAMGNMLIAVTNADHYYGNCNHPVTFYVLGAIANSFFMFISIIITYYSGVMVWRERSAKMNELVDCTSKESWLPLVAKYFSMLSIIGLFMMLAMCVGMVVQFSKGYYNFEVLLYFKQLFLIDGSQFAVMAAVAFFIHVMVNNMYLGFFVFIIFGLLNAYGWAGLDINSNLLRVGEVPSYKYSDMSQFMPYAKGIIFYNIYWLLFGGILLLVSSLFWVRGKSNGFKNRFSIARQRINTKTIIGTIVLVSVWMVTGGFLFYNAEVLNESTSEKEDLSLSAEYEIKYKKYDDIPQPRIIAIEYNIDMYPETRTVKSEIDITLKNKHDHPIDSIHFTCPRLFKTQLEVPQAKLVHSDEEQEYYIYHLDQAMQAGETMMIKAFSNYIPKGIENELSTQAITQNGTFIDNEDILPVIGYLDFRQLADNKERKKLELAPKERMHELHHDCSAACSNSYISSDSDWLRMSTTISTSNKQTAIAPGSLVKEWNEDGRNYFRYEVEKQVLNFCSFLSAEYEVKRERWNDVDLEVYYHKGHDYNIDRMLKSMRKSLDYNASQFTPYPHKQARIIEFPRFESFAQAFPGTMPYSENMGFLADMKDGDDIDRSFFYVAHEMAHQWWGHQAVAADVQGGTMLVESFAQYSALMVMEKEYGRDKMKSFLKYEMDNYLRSRGGEKTKEMPLIKVENQEYIHYRKGSVAMYAIGQYIGEDSLNKAMRIYAERFAQSEPPYPTALDFMDELEKVTPDSLRYLVDDFLRKIVLYSNKTESVSYSKLENDKYEVKLEIQAKKIEADEKGKETEIAIDDYIYLGVYGSDDRLIYYAPHKISKTENIVTIVVDELPTKAGIDPLNILIDEVPDDNVMEF